MSFGFGVLRSLESLKYRCLWTGACHHDRTNDWSINHRRSGRSQRPLKLGLGWPGGPARPRWPNEEARCDTYNRSNRTESRRPANV